MYGPDGTSNQPARPADTCVRGSVSVAGPSTGAGAGTSRAEGGLGPVHGPGLAPSAAAASAGPSSVASPSHPTSSSAAGAPYATADPASDAPRSDTPTVHTAATTSPPAARRRAPHLQQRAVRPRSQQTLDGSGWQRELHGQCTRQVGRFFYECGIPFAIADTWAFTELMRLVASVDGSWRPPRREALRGAMLRQEEQTITRELSSIRTAWER